MTPVAGTSLSLINCYSNKFCLKALFINALHFQKLFVCCISSNAKAEKENAVHRYVGIDRKRHGRLHVCGLTITGALGVPRLPLPKNKLRTRPKYVQLYPYPLVMNYIDSIACGYGFSIFSSRKRNAIKVWGCGLNTDSQLGFHRGQKCKRNKEVDIDRESYKYLMEPTPIPLPIEDSVNVKVLEVACGRAHTLILTDVCGVYTLGNNAFGQCGRTIVDGEIYENNRKVHVLPHDYFESPVVKIACGMDHSLFLTENGNVYACGWGNDGQTGLGDVRTTSEPKQLKGDIEGVKIKQISSFADTTLAVSTNSEVFAWGSSEYGQLACISNSTQVVTPTYLPFTDQGKICQVACGGTGCMLLNEVGEVWVWGYGILGKGPALENSVWPSQIPSTLFGCLELDSDVYVTKITCGLGSYAAITNRGELYTWGKNRSGCLGIGKRRDQFFPWKVIVGTEVKNVQCGVDHMIILSKSLL